MLNFLDTDLGIMSLAAFVGIIVVLISLAVFLFLKASGK